LINRLVGFNNQKWRKEEMAARARTGGPTLPNKAAAHNNDVKGDDDDDDDNDRKDGRNSRAGNERNEECEPERIGDYVFLQTLGQGSFGKVKLAQHIRTKEKVPRPSPPSTQRSLL
jgi:serine/threonine protein kinase